MKFVKDVRKQLCQIMQKIAKENKCVPLRKIMIIDYKLIYPSGTATAHLINSFHTSQGAKLAKKQGLKAYENRFYFDYSPSYVGVGMICPYIRNISLLVGAILSWGIMWPLIENREGDWYKSGLPSSNLHGIKGYRVFIAIAMILGDGLYNFAKVLGKTTTGLVKQLKNKEPSMILPLADKASPEAKAASFDDQCRTQLFLQDQIPSWLALGGYVLIASISTAVLPQIFHQLRWYYVLVIYIFAPVLAFCNAYGCGLTGWSLASTYGKLAIFTIGAWAYDDEDDEDEENGEDRVNSDDDEAATDGDEAAT
ncbi:putative metal-nicotianamine transporter YSL7 [Heracleum sosnowskyi]|uniref:Metal-nicotianamine transporter YSL7 n=1 Tax=Heracleum sosnowskyi TaxID=360622 RepID=A0AAD8IZ82_9APIA|nr:putative metal-nicotianamine transporter YSL7 [Heracleum sosnowskyi]